MDFQDLDHSTARTYISYLAEAVVNMDEKRSVWLARWIAEHNIDILDAIEEGLVAGMARAGDLYEEGEYFIPDLLLCADAMDAAMEVFEQYLPKSERKYKGRVVIGTIKGDTHDIGKNIVALLIRSAGFEVLDLGRDVEARTFVDQAEAFQADIIAISTLLTTTMNNMEEVIKLLISENKRSQYKIIIGGKPVSEDFARKIGADYYAYNAGETLRLSEEIIRNKRIN